MCEYICIHIYIYMNIHTNIYRIYIYVNIYLSIYIYIALYKISLQCVFQFSSQHYLCLHWSSEGPSQQLHGHVSELADKEFSAFPFLSPKFGEKKKKKITDANSIYRWKTWRWWRLSAFTLPFFYMNNLVKLLSIHCYPFIYSSAYI